MEKIASWINAEQVQAAGDLYQQAAQALLLAYQRNKQATRHHSEGAFRAALHHARESCVHVAQAHAHLDQALALSARLSAELPSGPTTGFPMVVESTDA